VLLVLVLVLVVVVVVASTAVDSGGGLVCSFWSDRGMAGVRER